MESLNRQRQRRLHLEDFVYKTSDVRLFSLNHPGGNVIHKFQHSLAMLC